MLDKRKVTAIGRLLISSAEIDSKRGENKILQRILGNQLYYQKNSKWYYNIEKLNKLSISKIKNLTKTIEKTIVSN